MVQQQVQREVVSSSAQLVREYNTAIRLLLRNQELLDPDQEKRATAERQTETQLGAEYARFTRMLDALGLEEEQSQELKRHGALQLHAARILLYAATDSRDKQESAAIDWALTALGTGAALNFGTLKWGGAQENEIDLKTGEYTHALWGRGTKTVDALSFATLRAAGDLYQLLTPLEQQRAFDTLYLAAQLALQSNNIDRANRLREILTEFLPRGEAAGTILLRAKLDILNGRFFGALGSPELGAARLAGARTTLLNLPRSAETLALAAEATRHEAPLLGKLGRADDLRRARQELEAAVSGFLWTPQGKETNAEALPLLVERLIVIQLQEIEAFRQNSRFGEVQPTIENLEKNYVPQVPEREAFAAELKRLRSLKSGDSEDKLYAGLRNALHEWRNYDFKQFFGVALAACAVGARWGGSVGAAVGSAGGPAGAGAGALTSAAMGCGAATGLVGIGFGVTHLGLGWDRIADGWQTGHTPHPAGVALAVDLMALGSDLLPLGIAARLAQPGTRLALRGASSVGVRAAALSAGATPSGSTYRLSEAAISQALENPAVLHEARALLGGAGKKFIETLLSAVKSGKHSVSEEELKGFLAVAATKYMSEGGMTAKVFAGANGAALLALGSQSLAESLAAAPAERERLLAETAQNLAMNIAVIAAQVTVQPQLLRVANTRLSNFHFPATESYSRERFTLRAEKIGIPREAAETIFNKHRDLLVPRDPLLSTFLTDSARQEAVERARAFQGATLRPVVYVEADVGNLGGMNAHYARLGQGRGEANRVLAEIAQIARGKISALGEAEMYRHGGDEISALVIGRDPKSVAAALQAVQQKVRAFTDEKGLGAVPPTKPNRAAGVGLAVGTSAVSEGRTRSQIFNEADTHVEADKITRPGAAVAEQAIAGAPAVAAPRKIRASVNTSENRPRFVDPEQYLQQQFRNELRRDLGEFSATRSLQLDDEALNTLAPKLRQHLPTGSYIMTAAARVETLQRAQEFAAQTGQPCFYVRTDFRNLAGVNAALGHTEANGVLSQMAEILRRKLTPLGGDFFWFSRGGGDLEIVAVNVPSARLEQALQDASREVSEIATYKRIPAAKAQAAPGIALDWAAAQLHPGVSLSEVFAYTDSVLQRKR